MSALAALARKDARAVFRDRFLVLLVFYSLALALVSRVVVARLGVPRLDLYLAPAMPLLGAMMLGTVLGFALIEEREQGTWLLLRVLPVPSRTVFGYLAAVATACSFAIGLAATVLYGYPVAHGGRFAVMLLAASATAPLVMLVLGAFGSNKVEGMALSKIVSGTGVFPAIVFLAPLPWQALVFWCPWYWLYVGLLDAFTDVPRQLPELYWPGFPVWLPPVVALASTTVALLPMGRLYARRAR